MRKVALVGVNRGILLEVMMCSSANSFPRNWVAILQGRTTS